MRFLKAVHKNGYEERYAVPGYTRFLWLHEGAWEVGSVSWEEMCNNIEDAGIVLEEWTPTPEELAKLENA